MLNRNELSSISDYQRANINLDKLRTIADTAFIVLDNVATSKDDILYRPQNTNALSEYTATIKDIVVNKLIAKFK